MLKADLYNFDGKKKEAITLPVEFDVKVNNNALSQAIHVYEDRSHIGFAKAKTRSEVAISTKKIYRQKGTGGARHGAKSAPIFVGGGAAHGPTGVKRVLRVLKSQGRKTLMYALKYKISQSRVVFVDDIEKIKKTKDADKLISGIEKEKKWLKKNILLVVSGGNSGTRMFFRNIKGVTVDIYKHLNAYKVFLANGIIVDRGIFNDLGGKDKKTVNKTEEQTKVVKIKNEKVVKTVKKVSKKKAVKK